MAHVLILVDALADVDQVDQTFASEGNRSVLLSPHQASAVNALKDAIALQPTSTAPDTVQILPVSVSASILEKLADTVVCPLTLNLPEALSFPAFPLFLACRDLPTLHQAAAALAMPCGKGEYWLPVVLTARGPLYGEAIAVTSAAQYIQPLHLSDRQRQPLYRFSYQLLRSLSAPPAVYLVQFGLAAEQVYFDRLLPFPAEPAIASLNVQRPNLFTCHWRCLTGQPILDLVIPPGVPFTLPQ